MDRQDSTSCRNSRTLGPAPSVAGIQADVPTHTQAQAPIRMPGQSPVIVGGKYQLRPSGKPVRPTWSGFPRPSFLAVLGRRYRFVSRLKRNPFNVHHTDTTTSISTEANAHSDSSARQSRFCGPAQVGYLQRPNRKSIHTQLVSREPDGGLVSPSACRQSCTLAGISRRQCQHLTDTVLANPSH
jgi:hypothetical protein